MNVFELIFFLGLLGLVVFGSKELGYLFSVTAWAFAVPLTAILILTFRWIGNRFRKRRMINEVFEGKVKAPPKDET